jgi:hypothetical protein
MKIFSLLCSIAVIVKYLEFYSVESNRNKTIKKTGKTRLLDRALPVSI